MSSTVTITGVVTDAVGATGSFSVDVQLSSFTGIAAVVTPSNGPAGTTRNLTVTSTGATAPISYGTPSAAGLTFTPVAGSPGQWTFVY